MSAPLVFVFFFMGAIALALSALIGHIIRREYGAPGLRRARNRIAIGGTLVTAAVFFAFLKAAPPEHDAHAAATIPAAWLAVIIAAIVIGLTLANRSK